MIPVNPANLRKRLCEKLCEEVCEAKIVVDQNVYLKLQLLKFVYKGNELDFLVGNNVLRLPTDHQLELEIAKFGNVSHKRCGGCFFTNDMVDINL